MNPLQYYFKVYRDYFNFSGRSRRAEFWWFTLIHYAILFVLVIGGLMIGGMLISEGNLTTSEEDLRMLICLSPALLYYIASFIPSYSVAVRRFHDAGNSGWLLFGITIGSLIIGLIGIAALVIYCTDSTAENKWGISPKYGGDFKVSDESILDDEFL